MSEQVTSPLTTDPSTDTIRVNLYTLYAGDTWEDQGAGCCVYQSSEDDEGDEIHVISNNDCDNTPLLESKVQEHTEYNRPQETLIVWTEENNLDVALLFEEIDGCEQIWQKIHGPPANDDVPTLVTDSDSDDTSTTSDDFEIDLLPPPDPSNLLDIVITLVNAIANNERERFAAFIIPDNYIGQLIAVFDYCEDQELVEHLHKLYLIMKAIVVLSDSAIIEHIVRDDTYLGVMGMLEYNPATPTTRAKHREFLSKCAATQLVVPIKDNETLTLIHETRRIKYLKENVLHESSDPTLHYVLDSMLFTNDRTIICNIAKNTEFLSELFYVFNSGYAASKNDAVMFVHELCNMTKNFEPRIRASLYRSFCRYGFVDMLSFALASKREIIRTSAFDILSSAVEVAPVLMQSQLFQNMEKKAPITSLMGMLIDWFIMRADGDLQVQLYETIRRLLGASMRSRMDTSGTANELRKQRQDSENFIRAFFDEYASTTFLRPFDLLGIRDDPNDSLELMLREGNVLIYLCELLCVVVREHSNECKTFFTTTDLFTKVVQLYRCMQAPVKYAALKFFRTCVGVADSAYTEKLIKDNIFGPTVRLLLDTKDGPNFLNSVCLELFEFIKKENIIPLVNHLITRYGPLLDTLTYTSPTLRKLRLQYEKNQQALEPDGQTPSMEDDDEEDYGYFSEDGDEYFNYMGGDEWEDEPPLTLSMRIPKELRPAMQDTNDISDQEYSAITEPQQTPERKRKRDGEDDDGDVHRAKFIKS